MELIINRHYTLKNDTTEVLKLLRVNEKENWVLCLDKLNDEWEFPKDVFLKEAILLGNK